MRKYNILLLIPVFIFQTCTNPVEEEKSDESKEEIFNIEFGGYLHEYGVTRPQVLTLEELLGPANANCDSAKSGRYVARGKYDLSAYSFDTAKIEFNFDWYSGENNKQIILPGAKTGNYEIEFDLDSDDYEKIAISSAILEPSENWRTVDLIEPYSSELTAIMEFCQAFAGIVNGNGLDDAAGYENQTDNVPHKIIILNEFGNPFENLNDQLPGEWFPNTTAETQIVAICTEMWSQIQACSYGGGVYEIKRFRHHFTLELYDAKTGNMIEENDYPISGIVYGPLPESCPPSSTSSRYIYGARTKFDDVIEWLRQYIIP